MKILALDAARGGFSVAVRDADGFLAHANVDGKKALEDGLAAVSQTMRSAGAAARDLDGIAVGIGPGSFTGVRIAISYAKSLALAWRLPLTGVDTFDALEAGVEVREPVLSVVRGRTGVISVRFRGEGGVRRASGYVADVLAQLDRNDRPLQLFGDAEDVLPGLAERGFNVQEISRSIEPTALGVALAAAGREPARSLHEIRADYGELPAVSKPKHHGALGESS